MTNLQDTMAYMFMSKLDALVFEEGEDYQNLNYPIELVPLQRDITDANFQSIEYRYQVGYWQDPTVLLTIMLLLGMSSLETTLTQEDLENLITQFNSLKEVELSKKNQDKGLMDTIDYSLNVFTKVLLVLDEHPEYVPIIMFS